MKNQQLLQESIHHLSQIDGDEYDGTLKYANGRSFTDAIRYITYFTPLLRKIGKYYIMDWICEKSADLEVIAKLDAALSSGQLAEFQVNYCYLEPELQLYGSEGGHDFDFPEAQLLLLNLIKMYWEGYLRTFSENCKFHVRVDEAAGRVEFYQEFMDGH